MTLPNGANSKDVDDKTLYRSYARLNAENWYTYTNQIRGREARNGDIRLVVGTTSARSWGMAIFSGLANEAPIPCFKFSPRPQNVVSLNLTPAHRWEYHARASKVELKSGPDKEEIDRLMEFDQRRGKCEVLEYKNQCLFIRTINITFQRSIWDRMVGGWMEDGDEDEDQQPHASSTDATYHPSRIINDHLLQCVRNTTNTRPKLTSGPAPLDTSSKYGNHRR